MGSYGEQNLVHGMSWIYFSPVLGGYEQVGLERAGVQFIVADQRLTTGLPLGGYYFERGEPGSLQHVEPLSPALLDKFDHTPFLRRIYDSGNIKIYSVVNLSSGQAPYASLPGDVREQETQKATQP